VTLPDKETRQWTAAEIELVRELADQVGRRSPHHLTKSWNSHAFKRGILSPQKRVSGEYLHELRTSQRYARVLKLILEGMADDPEEQQNLSRLTALPYTCSTSLMTF